MTGTHKYDNLQTPQKYEILNKIDFHKSKLKGKINAKLKKINKLKIKNTLENKQRIRSEYKTLVDMRRALAYDTKLQQKLSQKLSYKQQLNQNYKNNYNQNINANFNTNYNADLNTNINTHFNTHFKSVNDKQKEWQRNKHSNNIRKHQETITGQPIVTGKLKSQRAKVQSLNF